MTISYIYPRKFIVSLLLGIKIGKYPFYKYLSWLLFQPHAPGGVLGHRVPGGHGIPPVPAEVLPSNAMGSPPAPVWVPLAWPLAVVGCVAVS